MIHLKPQLIDIMLQKENEGSLCATGAPQPVDYFIPYLMMQRMPDDQDIRQELHHFVFIHATEERIRSIVDAEWNRSARLRMYHYRNHEGQAIKVSSSEMQLLRETIQSRQLKFFFGHAIDEMTVGDTVCVQMAPWVGKKGTITKMAVKKGKLNMTVRIDIADNQWSVNFTDVKEGDVIFDDASKERLLSGNLLKNFEKEMVDILDNKYCHKVSEMEAHRDTSRVTRMYGYSNITIDNPDDQKRFTALMLLCAYLLTDAPARDAYTSQLQDWLGESNPAPASDVHPSMEACSSTDAYLMLALFVVTRDPNYRDAVKRYLKSHPSDSPDILRHLLKKVKELKTKKPSS